MRCVVTNDDGIRSEGLQVLVRHLHRAGHDVTVVAPDSDWSGASASLGSLVDTDEVRYEAVRIDGAEEVAAYALDASPALTAIIAALGGFDATPDVVVSGINAGLNTGRAILHSGTVGAALTGQNFGLSGLAVSVEESDPWHWETAAGLAVTVLERLADAPRRSVLNLNVPAVEPDQVKGIRWTELAPFGALRSHVTTTEAGRVHFELVPTGSQSRGDTDQGAIAEGYASLTTLVGVAEAWPAEEGLDVDAPTDFTRRQVPGAELHEVHRVPDVDGDGATLRRPRLPEDE